MQYYFVMKKFIFTLIFAALCAVSCGSKDIIEERYLASATTDVQLYSIDEEGNVSTAQTFVRGRKVKANYGKGVKIEKQKYFPVEITKKQHFYAKEQSLVATPKEVAQEKEIWVRTPASIITDCETSLIGGLANKGEKLTVVDFDSLRADGRVNRYKIKQGNLVGYVYGKYLVFSKSEAEKRYKAEQYDKVHKAIKNPFGGGEAIGCDFYPSERVNFPKNKMPEACYSLYLNFSPKVIGNIESYIEFAKKTKINTFVLDIKDNECPGYKAEAMQKYSPTNYR